jgi:hypothetical protein
LDEKNPMYVGFAQENSFGSSLLHTLQWLVKGTAAQQCALAEKSVINMI